MCEMAKPFRPTRQRHGTGAEGCSLVTDLHKPAYHVWRRNRDASQSMGVGTVKARHGGQHGCEQCPMSTVQRALLRAVLGALVVVAVGPVGTAMAAPPNVTIKSPTNGSVSNNQTPSFNGTAEAASGKVTLTIYEGPSVIGGTFVQALETSAPVGTWSVGPAASLNPGTYTAQATQTNLLSETGTSEVTFTVEPPLCSASPSIKEQPTSQTVTEPSTATFTAAGSTPEHCAAPTVQWSSEAPGAMSFTPILGAESATYTTPATATTESGTKFEGTFKNAKGETTTDEVTLTVNAALCSASPSIKEQPTSQTVTEPSTATFTAAGSTPEHCAAPTVQWSSEAPGALSFTPILGAESATYTTPATATTESGTKFEGTFKNAKGETTTDEVTLTVNAALCSASPSIKEQPTSQTVTEPSTATFTAAGSTPEHCAAPTVQWSSEAPGALSFTPILGAESATYTTPATATTESGTKFEGTFKNAKGETTTDEVTLTVNAALCSASPSIKEQPTSQTVTEPSTATFTAAPSTPEHCAAPTVQWSSEAPGALSFTPILGAESATYTTPATATTESGTKFEGTFKNAKGETTTDEVTLTVNAALCSASPSIKEQPTSQTVTEPSTATFTAAGSTPEHCAAPTVQWSSEAPGALSFTPILGAESATYTTPATATTESGTKFEGTFKNAKGETTTDEVTLTVNAALAKPEVSKQPVAATVTAPATASFTAEATGNPAPSVRWEVSESGGAFTGVPGATSDTFTIPSTNVSESGDRYEAVFTNSQGKATSSAATLTVDAALVKPAVSKDPKALTVNATEAASFTAEASGNPAPSVRWEVSESGGAFTGVPGATSDTFTIPSTNVSESGDRYEAVFTNSQGKATSSAATLTVNAAPTITSIEPSSGPIAGGTSVTIKGTGFGTTTATNTVTTATNTVTIGGAAASVTAASAISLTVTTPARGAGAASVVVTNTTDGLSVTDAGGYTYIPPPTVTLNPPKSPSNNTTPSFTGTASETTPVTVKIYAGATMKGLAVSTATATGTGGGWSSGDASPALKDGQYTATATQAGSLGNPAGVSPPVKFTVDTVAPAVTITVSYTHLRAHETGR